jgi:hypothetical protein
MRLGRRSLFCAATLAIAITSVLWLSRGGSAPESLPRPAGPARAERPVRPARCSFSTGDRLTFDFSTSSTVIMDPTALLPGRPPGQAGPFAANRSNESRTLRGTMLWKVADASARDGESHWSVLATLFELTGTHNGQGLPPALSAQLAEPVWLDIDERCSLSRLGGARGRSPVAERQWRLLVGLIEMAMPHDASARRWTLAQEDAAGRYRAAYQRSQDDTRIEREKTAYLQARRPNNSVAVSIAIENARAVATASALGTRGEALAAGWFDALEVDEHARVLTESQQLFADASTHLSVLRKPTDDRLAFWASPADPSLVAWEPMAIPAQASRPMLRFAGQPVDPALQAMTAAQVAAAFSDLLSADRRKDDALKMMVQYLRLDGRHVDEMVGLIRRGGFDAHAQPFAFLALQLAGGSKARDALIAAAHDGAVPLAAQLQAVSALKDLPEPDAQVVGALRTLALQDGAANRERAEVAQLGLGSLVSRISPEDPLRQTVQEDLARTLMQASSNEELDIALAAVGNSRDQTLAPLVRQQLDAPSGSVRTAALAAYARMGGALPIIGVLDRMLVEDYPPCVHELGKILVAQAAQANAGEIDRAASMLAGAPPGAPAVEPLIAFLGIAARHSEPAMQALVTEFYRQKNPTQLALIGRYVPANRLP